MGGLWARTGTIVYIGLLPGVIFQYIVLLPYNVYKLLAGPIASFVSVCLSVCLLVHPSIYNLHRSVMGHMTLYRL